MVDVLVAVVLGCVAVVCVDPTDVKVVISIVYLSDFAVVIAISVFIIVVCIEPAKVKVSAFVVSYED